jgi:hypothetical protein
VITVEVVVRFTIEGESPEHAEEVAVDAIDMAYQHPFIASYWVCSSRAREAFPLVSTLPIERGRSRRRVRHQVSQDLVIIESEEDS